MDPQTERADVAGAGAAAVKPHRGAGKWLVEAVVVVVMGFLVWQGSLVWVDSDQAVTHFPQALEMAAGPRPADGYTSVGPPLLNREQPGCSQIGHRVLYVGPNHASSGPFVVSVHPINSFDWAAVALGDNGRCYAILISTEPVDPQYGGTTYATFPRGTGCVGSKATRATVTGTAYPQ